jgi:histidinol-phosphate aminotransferase
LREAIGKRHGIDPARVMSGHGSEDLIGLVARSYAGPGDEVVVSQYGYAMFPLAARIAGATVVTAKARALAPDVDALLAAVTPRTRILYLANPNNPTGACLAAGEVERLQRGLPDSVLLVLDAAYAEYVAAGDYEPGLRLAGTTVNTIMLRTFSKAYGLAGLRVGWLYGPREIVDLLDRLRPPTNIAGSAQAAAAAAIGDTDHLAAIVAENAATRGRFAKSAAQLGLVPLPSEGNFVLVRFPAEERRNAAAAYAFLRSRGILGRRMDPYGLPQYLRFTMGGDAEISAVLEALADFVG